MNTVEVARRREELVRDIRLGLFAELYGGRAEAEELEKELRSVLRRFERRAKDMEEARWENEGGSQAGFEEARRQSRPDDIT